MALRRQLLSCSADGLVYWAGNCPSVVENPSECGNLLIKEDIIEISCNPLDQSKCFVISVDEISVFSLPTCSKVATLPKEIYNKDTIIRIQWSSFKTNAMIVILRCGRIELIDTSAKVLSSIAVTNPRSISAGYASSLPYSLSSIVLSDSNTLSLAYPLIPPDYSFNETEFLLISQSLDSVMRGSFASVFEAKDGRYSFSKDLGGALFPAIFTISHPLRGRLVDIAWSNDLVLAADSDGIIGVLAFSDFPTIVDPPHSVSAFIVRRFSTDPIRTFVYSGALFAVSNTSVIQVDSNGNVKQSAINCCIGVCHNAKNTLFIAQDGSMITDEPKIPKDLEKLKQKVANELESRIERVEQRGKLLQMREAALKEKAQRLFEMTNSLPKESNSDVCKTIIAVETIQNRIRNLQNKVGGSKLNGCESDWLIQLKQIEIKVKNGETAINAEKRSRTSKELGKLHQQIGDLIKDANSKC